ncbi:MAG TPA: hypothetical protein VMG41_14620 [Gemmatimonadales bacterium]|nr:hypothetical protein [Gemmatimonadales bacterium]
MEWPIEPQLLIQRSDLLRRRGRTGQLPGRIARGDVQEDESQNDYTEYDRQPGAQTRQQAKEHKENLARAARIKRDEVSRITAEDSVFLQVSRPFVSRSL